MSYICLHLCKDNKDAAYGSIVSMAACVFSKKKDPDIFYKVMGPSNSTFDPAILSKFGYTRLQQRTFPHCGKIMTDFTNWILDSIDDEPILVSNTLVTDWEFLENAFSFATASNPFDKDKALDLQMLHKGLVKNVNAAIMFTNKKQVIIDPVVEVLREMAIFRFLIKKGLKI